LAFAAKNTTGMDCIPIDWKLLIGAALLHEEGLRKGEEMVSFDYHTKNCHETSIAHPQLV